MTTKIAPLKIRLKSLDRLSLRAHC